MIRGRNEKIERDEGTKSFLKGSIDQALNGYINSMNTDLPIDAEAQELLSLINQKIKLEK